MANELITVKISVKLKEAADRKGISPNAMFTEWHDRDIRKLDDIYDLIANLKDRIINLEETITETIDEIPTKTRKFN